MGELVKYKIGTKDNLLKVIPSITDKDKIISGRSPLIIYGKGQDSFSINPDINPNTMVCSNSSNVISISKISIDKEHGGVIAIHDRMNIPFSIYTPNGIGITVPREFTVFIRASEQLNRFILIGANSTYMDEVEKTILQTNMANISEDKGMELTMSFVEFSITYNALL